MTGRETEESSSFTRIFLLISFILSAVAVASFGFWYSMQKSETISELPVLKPNKTVFKIKPEDPGGKVIRYQESQVLRILEGLTETDNRTEKLLLPDAAPELPPVALVKENSIEEELFIEQKNSVKHAGNSTTNLKDSLESKTSPPNNEKDDIKLTDIIDQDNASIELQNTLNENSQEKITNNKNEQSSILEPINKPVPPKINPSNKTYKVQLAAFAKREKAEQQAAILMEKHKNRLNGIMLEVTKIDTGSSGIYWRVITEPLLQNRAVSTCNLLKSAGQDCIVRKIRKES